MVYSDDFEALENYLSSGLDVGQTRSSKPDFSLIDADVDAKNDMGLKAASVAKIAELSSLDENFDIIVQLLKSSEEG